MLKVMLLKKTEKRRNEIQIHVSSIDTSFFGVEFQHDVAIGVGHFLFRQATASFLKIGESLTVSKCRILILFSLIHFSSNEILS